VAAGAQAHQHAFDDHVLADDDLGHLVFEKVGAAVELGYGLGWFHC
jgi:hypothetical protein